MLGISHRSTGTLRHVTQPREPEAERVFVASLTAPALAREHLTEVCAQWDKDELDVAKLLVTELVSNAVRHGAGPVRVRATMAGNRLRVDVADDGAAQPQPQAPGPTGLGGRGLLILDSLADRWGVQPSTGGAGKAVWFELDLR